jgi:hypothetical protein
VEEVRVKRGGREVLYRIPERLWVDFAPDTPPDVRAAVHGAYVEELRRRLEAFGSDPRPQDNDESIFSTRILVLGREGRERALALLQEMLAQLSDLGAADAPDAEPYSAMLTFFRLPPEAADRAPDRT